MAKTTFSGPVASQNGFIENSFTTAERDAIVDPTAGLLIYNTDTNIYEVFNGEGFQPAFGPGVATLGTAEWASTYTLANPAVLNGIDKSDNTFIAFSITNPPDKLWLLDLPTGTTFTVVQGAGAVTGVLTTLESITETGFNSFSVYASYTGPAFNPGDLVSLFNVA